MTKFRPADVACLLSASNRRADIVRATPILFLSRDGDGRKRCSSGHRQGPIRSIAESRREGYDTFRLADAKQQAFTQRPFVGLSPKQPVSARVAPGLRTKPRGGNSRHGSETPPMAIVLADERHLNTMKLKEAEKRIQELERRLVDLERRPVYVPQPVWVGQPPTYPTVSPNTTPYWHGPFVPTSLSVC